MFRCPLVVLCISSLIAATLIAFDVDYWEFSGLTVEESLRYLEPDENDFSDVSKDSETDDERAETELAHYHGDYDGNSDEYEDYDDYDFDYDLYIQSSDEEEPCSPYIYDDTSAYKNSRREKRARDLKKDRPYRTEYLEAVRELGLEPLTKNRRRKFYDDARRQNITSKLSIKKAIEFAMEKDYSRRHEKIRQALLKNKRKQNSL